MAAADSFKARLNRSIPWIKPLLFIGLLTPMGRWIWSAAHGQLGADPIAFLTHASGSWALYSLFASLAMTPLRKLSGWAGAIRFRRMLGLFAFFYASVHLSVYLILDLGLAVGHLAEDIYKRPYITVGFLAWLLMLPLALTSTQAMMRRLGRRWQRLHRLVYLCAALACLHYWWLVKADWRWPAFFAALYLLLMAARWNRAQSVGKKAALRTEQSPL